MNEILKGTHPIPNLHDHILLLRQGMMIELEATMFYPIESSMARYYREPRRDWEEVIARFPSAAADIDEASKCYSLSRYPACIYHCMQHLSSGCLN